MSVERRRRKEIRGLVRFTVPSALVLATLAACARQSAPPGGPPDNVPPVVASTSPDTFAVVEPFQDPVTIRFSERISERPVRGTSLAEAVVVSPRSSELSVEHGRRSLEIALEEGWEAGHVYRVRVLPQVQDMFDNPMVRPFELVFSTGPDFRPGVLAGEIRDRITGEPVSGAVIRAVPGPAEDSVAYTVRADQEGIYSLRYLPPGPYVVTAFEDRNRSGDVDGPEPRTRDRAVLEGPADTVLVSLEVLAPDTTSARVTGVEALDSASLRIDTDDYLNPADSLGSVEVSLSREGGGAPAVDSLLHVYEWEARARILEERAAAAADTASDTTAADTLPPDTVPARPERPGEPPADTAAPDTATAGPGSAADTLQGPYGAGEPPRAEQSLYVLLGDSLEPGVEYAVQVSGIRNIAGVEGGGGTDSVSWEPPPPDTAVADTAAADTAGVAPDTLAPSPDTLDGGAPDTTDAAPDTAPAAADTAAMEPADGAVRGRPGPASRSGPPDPSDEDLAAVREAGAAPGRGGRS